MLAGSPRAEAARIPAAAGSVTAGSPRDVAPSDHGSNFNSVAIRTVGRFTAVAQGAPPRRHARVDAPPAKAPLSLPHAHSASARGHPPIPSTRIPPRAPADRRVEILDPMGRRESARREPHLCTSIRLQVTCENPRTPNEESLPIQTPPAIFGIS